MADSDCVKTAAAAPRRGSICTITGPMFSRKSTTLAGEKERAERARRTTVLFVPSCDNRYDAGGSSLATHDGLRVAAHGLDKNVPLLETTRAYDAEIEKADVVLVDECQWFVGLYDFCLEMSRRGKRVVVAGLTNKSDLSQFGETSRVVAIAQRRVHLDAVCVVCTEDAQFTGLTADSHARNAANGEYVGAVGDYVALCNTCYFATAAK